MENKKVIKFIMKIINEKQEETKKIVEDILKHNKKFGDLTELLAKIEGLEEKNTKLESKFKDYIIDNGDELEDYGFEENKEED